MKNKNIIISTDNIKTYAEKKDVIIEKLRKDISKETGDGSFDLIDQEDSIVKWDASTLSWTNGMNTNHLCAFIQDGERIKKYFSKDGNNNA